MNQVATKSENPLVILHDQMEKRSAQFQAALPAHIPPERFKRILLTAVQMNPALAGADRQTFWNSAMKAAQDGLLPDGRDGAMVIYKTKLKDGGQERWIDAVQWIPMVGGLRKKVRNSGEIATMDAQCVYEKDEFDYQLGDMPRIHHKPFMAGDRGKIIGAYSIATFKTGEQSREVMSVSEIEKVRLSSSKSKDKEGNATGPWRDHYGEMCRKTVFRRHSKLLPMSTDLDDLIRRDDHLYDLEGSKNESAPERPKLADFANAPQSAPALAKSPEAVNQDTGEVTDADYSAADAFSEGAQASLAGRAIDTLPQHLTAFPPLAEAWQEGWRSEQPE